MRIKWLQRRSFDFTFNIFYIRFIMKARQKLSAPAFRSLLKLTEKKYRQEYGKYLIEGVHLLGEALDAGVPLELLLVTDAALKGPEVAALDARAGSMGIARSTASAKEMERLCDAVTPQGILGLAPVTAPSLGAFWPGPGTPSLIVALEHVADPGNVGTILRTCDWFGVDAVFLSGESVELHNPKVVRSTMGALFHLPVFAGLDLPRVLKEAKKRGYHVAVSALAGGTAFTPAVLPPRSVVVLGNEASGVTGAVTELADRIVTIPRFGRGESLNVGAACAVILGGMKLR